MGVDNEKDRWKWVKGEEEKKWKENGEWERERRDDHQAAEAGVLNCVGPRFQWLNQLWQVTEPVTGPENLCGHDQPENPVVMTGGIRE